MGRTNIDLIFDPQKKTEISLLVDNIQGYDYLSIFDKIVLKDVLDFAHVFYLSLIEDKVFIKSDAGQALLKMFETAQRDIILQSIVNETICMYLSSISSTVEIGGSFDFQNHALITPAKNNLLINANLNEIKLCYLDTINKIRLSHTVGNLSIVQHADFYNDVFLNCFVKEVFYIFLSTAESAIKIDGDVNFESCILIDTEETALLVNSVFNEVEISQLHINNSIELLHVIDHLSDTQYINFCKDIILNSLVDETYIRFIDDMYANVTLDIYLSESHVRYRLFSEIADQTLHDYRNVAVADLYFIDS